MSSNSTEKPQVFSTEPVTRYETSTEIPSTVNRDGDIMSSERVHKVLDLLVIRVGVAIKQILSATNRNIGDNTSRECAGAEVIFYIWSTLGAQIICYKYERWESYQRECLLVICNFVS
jgi:hypothetical protein